jgi:hypothetical protein
MQIVIDTEFNGFLGELISMALVSEDGQEFYEVLDPDYQIDPWVQHHVLPKLGKDPIKWWDFADKLSSYLNSFSDITVIADWPEDIKHLCERLLTGPGQRMPLPDTGIKFEIRLGLPSTAVMSRNPHNALEDARALARHLGWKVND